MSIKKILVIQFKYLGDVVFITPALRALHQHYPNSEIHILVAKDIAPVLKHLLLIKKTWALPRLRGKVNFKTTLPFIRALRKEKFDLTIDFAGNDRGALLSYLVHAKTRLGLTEGPPKFLQKWTYTAILNTDLISFVWVDRYLEMLDRLLGIKKPAVKKLEIHADPALKKEATKILNNHQLIFHIGASEEKKEWPISHWLSLYSLGQKAGYNIAFSAGPNNRELALLAEIKEAKPDAFILPPSKNLDLFLATLNQAEVVISCDTGPLHFAAGLGKKIIGLFGVADGVKFYAPTYQSKEILLGAPCNCVGSLSQFKSCQSSSPCMHSIRPEQVFRLLQARHPL